MGLLVYLSISSHSVRHWMLVPTLALLGAATQIGVALATPPAHAGIASDANTLARAPPENAMPGQTVPNTRSARIMAVAKALASAAPSQVCSSTAEQSVGNVDVDLNGGVDSVDATLMLRVLLLPESIRSLLLESHPSVAGLVTAGFPALAANEAAIVARAINLTNHPDSADVDRNGIVDGIDATLMLRVLLLPESIRSLLLESHPSVAGLVTAGFPALAADEAAIVNRNTILSGLQRITGQVTYDRVPRTIFSGGTASLNHANIMAKAARGVTVQALDMNGSVLDTGCTDKDGMYALIVPKTATMRVQVLAQLRSTSPTWDVEVRDNTNQSALYTLVGDLLSSSSTRNMRAASGWGGSSYTDLRAAAPFAILDSIYVALQSLVAVDGNISVSALDVHWSPLNNNGAYYSPDGIFLSGDPLVNTDEYDAPVVLHEFAHHLEHSLSRLESIGGAHYFTERVDPRVAYSEGLATALGSILTDDPIFYGTYGGNFQGFYQDIESGASSRPGWFNEFSIAILLYDLYDARNEFGLDALTLGFSPLYRVLVEDLKTFTPYHNTIFKFVHALKLRNPEQASAIDVIVSAQGINSAEIDPYGSSETNSAGHPDVLPVYTPLLSGSASSATISVCRTDDFRIISEGNESFNKLSNRRFLRLDTTDAEYSISFLDPDVSINFRNYPSGASDLATGGGSITFVGNNSTYVLELTSTNFDEPLCTTITTSIAAPLPSSKPQIASFDPPTLTASDSFQALTLLGSNFTPSSIVQWRLARVEASDTLSTPNTTHGNSGQLAINFRTLADGHGTWEFRVVNGYELSAAERRMSAWMEFTVNPQTPDAKPILSAMALAQYVPALHDDLASNSSETRNDNPVASYHRLLPIAASSGTVWVCSTQPFDPALPRQHQNHRLFHLDATAATYTITVSGDDSANLCLRDPPLLCVVDGSTTADASCCIVGDGVMSFVGGDRTHVLELVPSESACTSITTTISP